MAGAVRWRELRWRVESLEGLKVTERVKLLETSTPPRSRFAARGGAEEQKKMEIEFEPKWKDC